MKKKDPRTSTTLDTLVPEDLLKTQTIRRLNRKDNPKYINFRGNTYIVSE